MVATGRMRQAGSATFRETPHFLPRRDRRAFVVESTGLFQEVVVAAGVAVRLPCSGSAATISAMSTLTEIENAIEQLPQEQWMEIRRWMDSHAPKAAVPPQVDWAGSHAVTRQRPMATRIDASVVAEALAAVRE